MDVGFPWHIVESVLGADGGAAARVTAVLRDSAIIGSVRGHPEVSGREYQRAVDRRSFEPLKAFCTLAADVALVRMTGRQVGSLGYVVATGRTVSSLAHVVIPKNRSTEEEVVIETGFITQLTDVGLRVVAPSRTAILAGQAARREQLLQGDAEATYWARAWHLPPRLARLAVLLMAGLSADDIARRMGLSVRSVRTYTEELFRRAGIHSRNELPGAALRDGA